MSLYAGDVYWNKTQIQPCSFEKLSHNTHTDVLIVGAGMSGTLCAYILSLNAVKVTVVDQGKVANGSSTANTGLLQYSSDKRISEFVKDLGEDKGVLFYKMCLEAMDHLTDIVQSLEEDTEYELKDSINYASEKKDRKDLLEDFEYLIKHDFPAEFLEGEQLYKEYNIDKSSALRTWHDAQVNPFKLIQALTKKNIQQGVTYYEDTCIDTDKILCNTAHSQEGYAITFNNIILTTGYTKVYPVIKDKCVTKRTYAFCSKPIDGPLWKNQAMIWETARPYLYFRTTVDHRIIAGGLDENKDGLEYNQDKIMNKAKRIAEQIEDIFPHLKIDIEYSWSALFYGSKDGLPFIGRDPLDPNKYYLLGYEGNGTCYSMAGAFILHDLIQGKHNIYTDLVKVDR